MKDYNEMVESLFERREKYQEGRRKRMRRIGRMASVVSCCCLVLLAGIGVFKGDLLSRDPAELLKGGSDDCSQSSGLNLRFHRRRMSGTSRMSEIICRRAQG